MSDKLLKIPISCRIYPELKEALENEANELGLTTSLYLEEALQSRHLENEKIKDAETEIESLKSHIQHLQHYSEELELKIQNLKQKKNGLKEQFRTADNKGFELNKTVKKLDSKIQPFRSLGISKLAPKNVEELDQYFTSLEDKYPDLSRIQLLLAALNCTVKNEKGMFIIHTISRYPINEPQN